MGKSYPTTVESWASSWWICLCLALFTCWTTTCRNFNHGTRGACMNWIRWLRPSTIALKKCICIFKDKMMSFVTTRLWTKGVIRLSWPRLQPRNAFTRLTIMSRNLRASHWRSEGLSPLCSMWVATPPHPGLSSVLSWTVDHGDEPSGSMTRQSLRKNEVTESRIISATRGV